MRMVLPAWAKQEWIKTPNFVARPAQPQRIEGHIQNGTYEMYDLTPEQYDSLIKLTAALCTALPKIKPDYPRDANGNLITKALPDSDWEKYQGVMGHVLLQLHDDSFCTACASSRVLTFFSRRRTCRRSLSFGSL